MEFSNRCVCRRRMTILLMAALICHVTPTADGDDSSNASPEPLQSSDLAGVRSTESATEIEASSVGVARRIHDLILPGTELTTKPISDETPIVLRIINVRKHGSSFRYDLEYFGLEPGQFDLRDYLVRTDGKPADDLPPLVVTVQSLLPEGQVEPHELERAKLPRLSRYQFGLILAGVVWGVVFLALLCWPKRRTGRPREQQREPVTLADRLRPMVDSALQGEISDSQKAELERLLLAYWHDELQLADLSPTEAIQKIRRHPTAGELLTALESWLHRPDPPENIDVNRLLEPYRNRLAEKDRS